MTIQFAHLVTLSSQLEAEILRGMLEANRIEVILSGEAASKAIGLAVGPLAEVEVLVPASMLESATELLQAYLGEETS